MEKYENKVILQGKVFAVDSPKENIRNVLLDTTISHDGKNRNIIRVSCVNEANNIMSGYHVGDFVRVFGYLQSRRVKSASRLTMTQGVVAEEVLAPTSRGALEFGTTPRVYEKVNEVYIAGVIAAIFGTGIKNILVDTVHGGKASRIMVKVFENAYNKDFLGQLIIGDTICASGTLQTKQRKKTVEEKSSQNLQTGNSDKNRTKSPSEFLRFENLVAYEVSLLENK